MMARRRYAVLSLSMLALTGCQDYGGPINGAEKLSPEERRLQEVEDKMVVLQRRLDSASRNGVDQELQRLREDVSGLRGDVEKLRFDNDSRERSTKELVVNLDRRLQAIEGGSAGVIGGVGTAPGASPGTLTAIGPQRPAVASPEEEGAYLATFDLLKNGKYDDAIRGFRGMLDKWPQGRYADNAWYWMGEANYVKRDYSTALTNFQSLVQQFPGSPKMADGLLKMGLCQTELKRSGEAKAAFQRVVRDFPTSNAANLAKQKLEQMGG